MIFQKVTLTWDDKKYVIPADQVLPAIAVAEEFLTLHELEQFQKRKTAPLARIAQAYGAVLRFAGCSETNEEVYKKIIEGKIDAGKAITALLLMMLPPDPPEAPSEGNGSAAEGKSSKKLIKSPSAD